MRSYMSPFTPQTDVGQGLQNIAMAMFAGPKTTTKPSDEALMRDRLAQADYHVAQAADKRSLTSGRENFLTNSIPSLGIAGDDVPSVQAYLKSGIFPAREDPRLNMSTVPGVPVAGWSPETESGVRDLQALAAAVTAGGGNTHQIMQGAHEGRTMRQEQGVLDGTVDPTKWFQMNLKPTTKVDEGYAYNPAGVAGATPVIPLDTARALAGERDAHATEHTSRAAKLDAEAGQVKPKADAYIARQGRAGAKGSVELSMTGTDEDGNPIFEFVPKTEGQEVVKPKKGTPAQKKPLTRTQQQVIAGALSAKEEEMGAAYDAETRAQMTSRATQLASDPESEFYQDPAGAIDAAINEDGEMDITGKWNPFTKNVARPKNKAAAPAGKSAVPAAVSTPDGIPKRPATVPPGSAWSPSRRMWRAPDGMIYNESGASVGG